MKGIFNSSKKAGEMPTDELLTGLIDDVRVMRKNKLEIQAALDELWRIDQVQARLGVVDTVYQQNLDNVKSCGIRVFRNSKGEHNIVLPVEEKHPWVRL